MENKKSNNHLQTDPIIKALKGNKKSVVALNGFVEVDKKIARLYARPESSVYIEFDLSCVKYFISPKSDGMPTKIYVYEDAQLQLIASSSISASKLHKISAGAKRGKGCSCSSEAMGASSRIDDKCHDQWWECVQGPLSIDLCNLLYEACLITSKFPDTMAPTSSY